MPAGESTDQRFNIKIHSVFRPCYEEGTAVGTVTAVMHIQGKAEVEPPATK